MISNSGDMSYYEAIPPSSNPLWVAMETIFFTYPKQVNFLGRPCVTFIGLYSQFGTHEKLSGEGVHSNLNWLMG